MTEKKPTISAEFLWRSLGRPAGRGCPLCGLRRARLRPARICQFDVGWGLLQESQCPPGASLKLHTDIESPAHIVIGALRPQCFMEHRRDCPVFRAKLTPATVQLHPQRGEAWGHFGSSSFIATLSSNSGTLTHGTGPKSTTGTAAMCGKAFGWRGALANRP